MAQATSQNLFDQLFISNFHKVKPKTNLERLVFVVNGIVVKNTRLRLINGGGGIGKEIEHFNVIINPSEDIFAQLQYESDKKLKVHINFKSQHSNSTGDRNISCVVVDPDNPSKNLAPIEKDIFETNYVLDSARVKPDMEVNKQYDEERLHELKDTLVGIMHCIGVG